MTKHVVFVGLDGVQYSELLQLGSNGITNLDAVEGYAGGVQGSATQQQTVSGPGWSTLLTGVWANEHGITGNSNTPINSAVQSLFERIDGGIPDAKIASIVHWSDINTGHFALETGRLGSPSIVDYQASGLSDADVVLRGASLIKTEAPDFTFLHLDDPDGVGHASGFGDAYHQELSLAATQVNDIMTAVAERQALNPGEEWMVIVSTDHGRNGNGTGHGGQSAGERQIFIASNVELSSAGAAPQTSVAATILDFLGIDVTGVNGPSLLDEAAIDTRAPYLLDARPADDLRNVPVDAALTLVLSERVQKGEGEITIHRASDGAVVDTIAVGSDQVSISAGVVTVHLSAPLATGTDYYVNVDAGAFVDFETRGLTRLFSENFESLSSALQPYQSSTEVKDADLTDWTGTTPEGWTHVNNTPAGGPPEFWGWTFHDKTSWMGTTYENNDNKRRGEFTKGQGVVAVADGDEYDDKGNIDPNLFRTLLKTPQIDVSGLADHRAILTFDSSWLPEAPQEARVVVTFDNGESRELTHWSSTASNSLYKGAATNETVTLTIDVPDGVTKASLSFEMVQSGNNWWWAIDNVAVDGVRSGTSDGNAFAGINDTTSWNFTTSSDTPLPQVVSLTPADDAGNVAPDAPLVITFDETVRAGSGSIVIHRADGSVFETISVGSDRVSISGAVVTVHPGAGLAYDTGYYVSVDAGAFLDLDTAGGSAFEGIDDAAGWNFTTGSDKAAPKATGISPADDAGNVAASAPLSITFDEAVRKGQGSIVLHRADGTIVETLDVRSDAVAIDDKTVTIHPGAALAAGDYYVTVAAGAFEDLALTSERTLFSENFEELTSLLHSYTSPTEMVDGDPTDWTATAPEGWTHVNNTPAGGPPEFWGWTFHDKTSWTATAGDQGRSGFTKGQGVVAVADGDEYDDIGNIDPNLFRTLLRTPDFGVTGLQGNRATLTFDSSWLPEAPQEVRLIVTFDTGATAELMHWSSTSGSPTYKGAATNEAVALTIDVPQGAHTANLAFDMMQSGNNWWWALDNIVVKGTATEPHGNAFAGISDPTAWNFSVAPLPETPNAGTPGDDVLTGTAGADVIAGLAGDDTLNGLGGADTLDGGAGDDVLAGGEGVDTLIGGAGDDRLSGGAGDDVVSGGTGDDTIDGGEGTDTLVLSGAVRLDLVAGTASGEELGNDAFSGIEGFRLGSGDDNVTLVAGASAVDPIDGGAGDDLLVLTGNGTLGALAHVEQLRLEGAWRVTGIGADVVFTDGAQKLAIDDAFAGTISDFGPDDRIQLVGIAGTEAVLGADNLLTVTGGPSGPLTLHFDPADDYTGMAFTLEADGNGGSYLSYAPEVAHDDVYVGGNGNDAFDGGAGNDDIRGRAGNDTLAGGSGADFIDGGSGADTVSGGTGDDVLNGGSGMDIVEGGSGNDVIDGGSEADILLGGLGNDRIAGGSGNDVITGGAGEDVLLGGSGSDSFVFAAGSGRDTIADFTAGDVIEFASGVVNDFDAVLAASDQVGGDVVVAMDSDTSITLSHVALASLTADDFRFAA